MNIKAYKVNVFAKTKNGGNPAGVVLDANNLSEKTMKEIAKTLGFSETAFIMKSDVADFKIRFFTPSEEVDLCGHATIGSFFVLLKNNIVKTGLYTQETKAGILEVEINEDDIIMMTQTNPKFYETIDYKEIAQTLNISMEDFDINFPCQIVSTGLKDILIPIKNKEILNSIKPNFAKVKELSKKYNVIGYHMFAINEKNNKNIYCRNLAPLYDIDEEAATGTSNGALACYLYKYKVINSNEASNIIFEQGYSMNKPSMIIVSLSIQNSNINKVKVGGTALNMNLIDMKIDF
ncbi:PhzF family phenazine biosynthesis protein [Peptostreptococcaceae bacterium AGR-M142]